MDSSTLKSYITYLRFGEMDSTTANSNNTYRGLRNVFGGVKIMFIVSIVACVSSSVKGTQNVAVGKSAYQTSTGWGGDPNRAVDGNTGGDFHLDDSCSHTSTTDDAWWKVDLGDVYVIENVTLYNRLDCCGEWLKDVQVFIGLDDSDYALQGYHSGVMGTSYTFHMPPYVYGRWVKVSRLAFTLNPLILCEVQVIGSEIENAKVLKLKQIEGVIGNGVLLGTAQASSMIECCLQCKKTSKCVAVNYNSDSETCEKLETVPTTSDSNECIYFYRLN